MSIDHQDLMELRCDLLHDFANAYKDAANHSIAANQQALFAIGEAFERSHQELKRSLMRRESFVDDEPDFSEVDPPKNDGILPGDVTHERLAEPVCNCGSFSEVGGIVTHPDCPVHGPQEGADG